ncbi:MAG: hypothetical protein ABR600_07800, partial [Actinomycetota bacterium]
EHAMRRSAILTAAVLALAAAALVFAGLGSPASAKTYPSTVSIHQVMNPKQLAVAGKVLSARRVCRHNREVQVFQRVPGPDTLIGSSNTGSGNHWGPVVVPSTGRYYAQIEEVQLTTGYKKHNRACSADISSAVHVTNP